MGGGAGVWGLRSMVSARTVLGAADLVPNEKEVGGGVGDGVGV